MSRFFRWQEDHLSISQVALRSAPQCGCGADAAIGMHTLTDDLKQMVRSCSVLQCAEMLAATTRRSDSPSEIYFDRNKNFRFNVHISDMQDFNSSLVLSKYCGRFQFFFKEIRLHEDGKKKIMRYLVAANEERSRDQM